MKEFFNLTFKKYVQTVWASFRVAADRKLEGGCSLFNHMSIKIKFHRSWTSRPAQCGLGWLGLLLHRELRGPSWGWMELWRETGKLFCMTLPCRALCAAAVPLSAGGHSLLLHQISESQWTLESGGVSWWSPA